MVNTEQHLKNIFNSLNEKPIVYQRIYAKITGSVTAGLLLSQLIYWAKTKNYQEFFKTDLDFCEELSMGLEELRGAKKRIAQTKIFQITRKGLPAKTYYQINLDRLLMLLAERQEQVTVKPQNQLWQNSTTEQLKTPEQFRENPTTITEIISNNTTKITTEKNAFCLRKHTPFGKIKLPAINPESKSLITNLSSVCSEQSHGAVDSKSTTEFEQFWQAYPKKISKFYAQKAFEVAIKKTTLKKMLEALLEQAKEREHCQSLNLFCREVCNPSTWLNGERWNDEVKNLEELRHEAKSKGKSTYKSFMTQDAEIRKNALQVAQEDLEQLRQKLLKEQEVKKANVIPIERFEALVFLERQSNEEIIEGSH